MLDPKCSMPILTAAFGNNCIIEHTTSLPSCCQVRSHAHGRVPNSLGMPMRTRTRTLYSLGMPMRTRTRTRTRTCTRTCMCTLNSLSTPMRTCTRTLDSLGMPVHMCMCTPDSLGTPCQHAQGNTNPAAYMRPIPPSSNLNSAPNFRALPFLTTQPCYTSVRNNAIAPCANHTSRVHLSSCHHHSHTCPSRIPVQ
jgi:hypothetical protein